MKRNISGLFKLIMTLCIGLTIGTGNVTGQCSFDFMNVTNVMCTGGADGMAEVIATTANPPFTYMWNDPAAQTTQIATGLAAGAYVVTVTDNAGCNFQEFAIVSEPTPVSVMIGNIDQTDCDVCDGAIDLVVNGGTAPYMFEWSNGFSTTSIAGLCAGSYCFTITDANACTETLEVTVTSTNSSLSASISGINPVSCFGGFDGQATVNASGGTPPYTYNWFNGEATSTAVSLPDGQASVTVVDNTGCVFVQNCVEIPGPSAIAISQIITTDANCTSCDGAADMSVIGGVPPYTYLWSNGHTQEDAVDLCVGLNVLSVTDNDGCTAFQNVFIGNQSTLVIDNIAINNEISCNGAMDGELNAVVSGGQMPYTYLWNIIETTMSITGLPGDVYSVTVTDADGCIDSESINLTEPDQLNLLVQNLGNTNCFAGADGSAEAIATGGTLPYSYAWWNGETTQIATGLNEGIHQVTVTDANGCSISGETSIIEPPPLQADNLVSTEPSCNNGSAGSIEIDVAGGMPPYNYVWQLNGIFFSDSEDITGLTAGVYDVLVTDDNGCTATNSTILSEPDELIVSVINTTPSTCGNNDGSITIGISGGTPPYFYSWSTGDTHQNLDDLSAGYYTVSVTDMNGCVATEENIIISDSDGPMVDIGADIQICLGESIQLTPTVSGVSGSEIYTWIPNENLDDPNIVNPIITPTQDITLLLIVNDNGCIGIDEVFIDVYTFEITAQMTNPASCGGGMDGEFEVIPQGGIPSYLYSLDLTDWQPSPVFSGLGAGSYVVYATDAFGCFTQTLVDITDGPPVPPIVIAIPPQFNSIYNCDDVLPQAEVTLYLSGGLPFESQSNYIVTISGTTLGDDVVDDPFPGMVGGDVQYTFNVANGDNWTATVYDETGCHFDMITDIFEYSYDCQGCTNPFDVTADAGVDQFICGSGTVTLGGFPAGTSTTGGESYAWSPAVGLNDATIPNPTASVSAITVYTLVVTDANGCIATDDVVVSVSPEMSIQNSFITEATCAESSDGSIDFVLNGGTPPFSYDWSGPNGYANDQPPPAINLAAGEFYCVTITDLYGCTVSDCYPINAPPPLEIELTTKDDCGDSDGWATVFATGGIGTYTINWTTGESANSITDLDGGFYGVTVTDENNCSTSEIFQIFEEDCVWAGDANYDGIADNDDVLALGLAFGETGPTRAFNFPEWVGVPADVWSGNFNSGVNHKHADCNGDGIVNQDDTLAITINYNLTHTVNFGQQGTVGAPPLTFVIEPDTVGPSDLVRVDILYGEMNQPVNDLYGIALTVDYDASLVVPGSVTCDFSESWIGSASETVWLSKELNGMVDLAIARTDQTNINGFGLIGTVYLVIEDNVDGFAPQNEIEMNLDFLDVNAISFNEEEVPFSLTQGTLVIDPELTSIHNPWLEKQVDIYPNPTSEKLFIEVRNVKPEMIKIYDILGKEIVSQITENNRQFNIDVSEFQTGSYIIQISTDQGVVSKRIVVSR